MSAVFVSGDLFKHAGLDGLAHGCNCAGAMGKGIAVEFKKRFPKMYDEYVRRCGAGSFKPGDVFVWREGDLTVFNLGTEAHWRTGATLEAVEASVRAMVQHADEHGVGRVGLPRIGAGLGGLDWRQVRAMLERAAASAKVELVVFEEFKAS